MKKLFSIVLSVLIISSAFAVSTAGFSAASAEITYSFTGDNSDKAGFAEGTITLRASAGTYWLYWADDTKALDGYYKIAKLTVSGNSASHKMYAQTAIPADATKLIAINSSSEPSTKTVANASAVYSIPENKLLGHKSSERLYRFEALSDIHIDAVYGYKYSEQHFSSALETANKRNVDFIITSGDHHNNTVDYSGIYAKEWKIYQRLLAKSNYCNPIYEGIGNHELWQGVDVGTKAFINATGLEGNNNKSDKAYYEKTIYGDHFIFMALEGGFHPNEVESFSDAQLDWLEGLLVKYSGDGHNIYIIEHSLFDKYGAGDNNAHPYYDIPLTDDKASTRRFKALLEQYKDSIFISGHTHIAFSEQYNYSNNGGTSAHMIHNSSCGAPRYIVNGALSQTSSESETEGYIVDAFDNAIIFNGANLYDNKYDPNCCYIITTNTKTPETTTSSVETISTSAETSSEETTADNTTEPVTDKPTETEETTFENSTTAEETTEPSDTEADSTEETKPTENHDYLIGDVDGNEKVNIKDATLIQKNIAKLVTFDERQEYAADVNRDEKVNIKDATLIQKKIANLISDFTDNGDKDSKIPAGASTLSEVKDNLDLYYRYSSYDSYQALKKEYYIQKDNSSPDYTKLTSLQDDLLSIVDPDNVDGNGEVVTVYFENTNSWSEPHIYIWGSGSSSYEKKWPGNTMTKIGKNEYGHSIYKYTLDMEKYPNVIFNNGNDKQTKDIVLTAGNMCYYLSSDTSPYSVTSYAFKDKYIVSQ